MPLAALSLTLVAAVLHAAWNLLAKSAKDTSAYMWWALLFGSIGYGVYLLATYGFYLPRTVWLLYLTSLAAELVYLATLLSGYREGDLSLVYPLSRGSPPVFLAIWGALILGERLPALGYMGLALMIAGILTVSYRSDDRPRPRGSPSPLLRIEAGNKRRAVFWALASGVFISIYSLLDKVIVGAMSPLVYNWWVYAGMTVGWAPFIWRPERMSLNLRELRTNYKLILLGSVTTLGAYVTVLIALTMTSASYVVAGRGVSVLIGALLGWRALGEPFGRLRVLGAALMVSGLILIAIA